MASAPHDGSSLVPVPGRDIKAQAWYQGGLSLFDFTDPAKPFEIGFFDRGPISDTTLVTGGYWSTYWHNGKIYGSEIVRGFDVLELTPSEFLTENEIAAAKLARLEEFNAQEQPRYSWPTNFVVARAYLDQLVRAGAVSSDRAMAWERSFDQVESGSGRSAGLRAMDAAANALDADARADEDGAHSNVIRSRLAAQIRDLAVSFR